MRARSLLLVVLLGLAAAGLFAWLTGDEDAPPHDEALHAPATDEDTAAELTARGTSDASPRKRAPVVAPRPLEDGRTWTLDVRGIVRPRHMGFGMDWPDDGTPDSPLAGTKLRLELVRGKTTREIGIVALDGKGSARIEVGALETMDPLDRAASRIRAVPLGADVCLAPEPHNIMNLVNKRWGAQHVELPGRTRPPVGDVTLRLMVILDRGPFVTGRAVRKDGSPLAGAFVSFYGPGDAEAADTCTGEDGTFRTTVSTGGTFSIGVRGRDGSHVYRSEVPLAAGEAEDLGDLVVDGKHPYAGRITYADGTPVRGIPIHGDMTNLAMFVSYAPESLTCQHNRGHLSITDADGRYALYLEEPQEKLLASVHARVPGNARIRPTEGDHFGPREPGTSHDGVLDGCELRFEVHDPDGRPIRGARVHLHEADDTAAWERPIHRAPKRYRRRTNSAGTARLWMAHGSRWTATAVLDGAEVVSRPVTVPAKGNRHTVAFVLKPLDGRTGLAVTLHDPDGKPLAPVVIKVWTEEGVEIFGERVERAGFVIPVAADRRYRLKVRSIEHAPHARAHGKWLASTHEVEAKAGVITPASLKTSSACHLEITLRAAPGTNDPGWGFHPELTVTSEDGSRVERTWIRGLHGGVAKEILRANLEPGTWTVQFTEDGYKPVTKRVVLERGILGTVEILVEREVAR